MKKTKILCTIGPASEKKETIKKMFEAGMDAVRINTSHGSFSEYIEKIETIRSIANIPILMDTAGPQIRLVSKKIIKLEKGKTIKAGFTPKKSLFFSKDFFEKIKEGKRILLSDGLSELQVIKKNPQKKEIILKALNSITLKGNMHSNIPSVYLNTPILSKRDKKVIRLAKKKNIDFIDLSFTRRKEDIIKAKKLLKGSSVGIIAKIENGEGVQKIDEILTEADGIMVARGDLGLEIPSEEVPLVQKEIVRKCNQAGKTAIIATQMLASMVENPRPTRAETSDVANAILDGADCITLTNETAVGAYPVKAVIEIKKIALRTEPFVKNSVSSKLLKGIPDTVSKSIYNMSKHLPVKKIITITKSGFTAKMISRFKPSQPIISITSNPAVERKLKICYGVTPMLMENIPEKKKIAKVAEQCYKKGFIGKEDLAIFTAGIYLAKEPSSNTIQIHKISDLLYHARR